MDGILIRGLILFLVASLAACSSSAPPPQLPPPEVLVVNPAIEDVPIVKEFVGQIYGRRDIPIRARVEGYLQRIHFAEGSTVQKGQLLYSIDQQPFLANVARYKSQLAESKIKAVRAQSELDRIEPLAANNAVSQSDLDAAVAEKGAADAAVEAAEASLRLSEIELGYTRISSPLKGIIGKTNAKVGEFVGRNPNPVILNTVSQTDSFLVEFFLPERDYLAFAREVRDKIRNRDLSPDDRFPIRLILADGSLYPFEGQARFVDREVNPNTGSLLIQTIFPNPDRIIRPGQFAKIQVTIDILDEGMLIPQRCVSEFQGQQNALVVTDSNRVEQRTLVLGPPYKDYWVVLEGLEANDRVIFEGIQRAQSGTTVNPKAHQFVSQVSE